MSSKKRTRNRIFAVAKTLNIKDIIHRKSSFSGIEIIALAETVTISFDLIPKFNTSFYHLF